MGLPRGARFGGPLLGPFTQRHSPAVAASMSSALFGLWHVRQNLRTLPGKPAGARVHGQPQAGDAFTEVVRSSGLARPSPLPGAFIQHPGP